MTKQTVIASVEPKLLIALGVYAIVGCILFIVTILIADVVVPDHDWVADTISDLGAGKYEFIVDVGIYAFSAALIAIALGAAHFHPGGLGWSIGSAGFALIALLVFLIGARNEYGDADQDGVVIHSYLVYALGFLFIAVPLLMAKGAGRANTFYKPILIVLTALWAISAPIFFILPNDIDGAYERYLGGIAMAVVATFAHLFITQGRLRR